MLTAHPVLEWWGFMDLAIVILLTLLMVPVAFLASGAFRIVLATAFLVFIPGYALVAALFPRKDSLDRVERATLSLVLSLAVVPLLGMALNYTPWGIDTCPVIATVLGFILICSAAALWRRLRLPKEDRFTARPRPALPRPAGTALDRALAGALALVAMGALGTLVWAIAAPAGTEDFSEFYLLGDGGLMHSYPQEAFAGQPVEVSLAITNQEHARTSYVVEAAIGEDLVSRTEPIWLANGQSWQGRLSFAPATPGADQRVEFRLLKNGSPEPYLTLHLMLDVKEQP